jgi:hypothetical protein
MATINQCDRCKEMENASLPLQKIHVRRVSIQHVGDSPWEADLCERFRGDLEAWLKTPPPARVNALTSRKAQCSA